MSINIKQEQSNITIKKEPQDAQQDFQEMDSDILKTDTSFSFEMDESGRIDSNQTGQSDQTGQTVEKASEPQHVRKIYIGGLNLCTTNKTLKKHFEQWGEVSNVSVIRDFATKKSRGYAFLTFSKAHMAVEAKNARPHRVDGRDIRVEFKAVRRSVATLENGPGGSINSTTPLPQPKTKTKKRRRASRGRRHLIDPWGGATQGLAHQLRLEFNWLESNIVRKIRDDAIPIWLNNLAQQQGSKTNQQNYGGGAIKNSHKKQRSKPYDPWRWGSAEGNIQRQIWRQARRQGNNNQHNGGGTHQIPYIVPVATTHHFYVQF